MSLIVLSINYLQAPTAPSAAGAASQQNITSSYSNDYGTQTNYQDYQQYEYVDYNQSDDPDPTWYRRRKRSAAKAPAVAESQDNISEQTGKTQGRTFVTLNKSSFQCKEIVSGYTRKPSRAFFNIGAC